MQNVKILNITTILLLLVAAATCRLLPRLDTGLRKLPVDRFPRSLAGWNAGSDVATDPAVQVKLPTAHILERNYTNARGNVANLMLVTATDDEDFHNPTACLPAQGWTLRNQADTSVSRHPVRVVSALQNHNGFTIFYYWVKLKTVSPPRHSVLSAALALRKRVAHEELSLFVRVAMPDGPQNRADLMQFTAAVWEALQPIVGRDAEIVLRS